MGGCHGRAHRWTRGWWLTKGKRICSNRKVNLRRGIFAKASSIDGGGLIVARGSRGSRGGRAGGWARESGTVGIV